jgi:hypothetical protein
MGVGGKFWDLLKPYARHEGPDFLREKRVAVDLSYWIVQHETAIKATHVRKPHLRLTFFRTINLFSKVCAIFRNPFEFLNGSWEKAGDFIRYLFLFGCNGRKFFSFLFIFAVWSASRICC